MSDVAIQIETGGEAVLTQCPDCGRDTRQVWGHVANSAGVRAAYFICWTEGHLERGALLALSIGNWGASASPAERSCVGIECRMDLQGPQFMIVNAHELQWRNEDFLGEMLSRDAALGKPGMSREVFSILDGILESDHRFQSFLAGASEPGLA